MTADDELTIDEQPTVLERPGRRVAGVKEEPPPEPRKPVRVEAAVTTLETMRAEELQNMRGLIRMGRILGITVLLPMPFLGGSQLLRLLFAALVFVAISVGYVVDRRLKDPARYSEGPILGLALVTGTGTCVGLFYWGIFSAAQAFPVLGLYFYARRVALAPALGVYIGWAVVQGIAAAVVIAGVVDDPGVYGPELGTPTLLFGHLLIQLGYLSAFVLGRYSHRAARVAIERMHRALRLAAQREALLYEARQDLVRALRVGDPGRYTDQTFGSYRLGPVIGHGGMGEVYEAAHVESGEPAAVKLLPVRELADEHNVARFLREMHLVSSLRSPHVVRVLETSEPDDPIPYLVMERLSGKSLAELLRDGAVSVDHLDSFLRQVGAALDAARDAGIVHRDLKPHNLLLDRSDGSARWKVLDFGVATLSESTGTLTGGRVVGTPLYMAPEQARGEPVDHRADLYSLGAIAYRWLTGRPPFAGRDAGALLYQVVNAMPERPSAIAGLPPEVDAVMAIALAKQPADRFAGARELRDALLRALAGELSPSLEHRAEALLSKLPWR